MTKNKVTVCPKCGGKGKSEIDCPNESYCLVHAGNGHYMTKCPIVSASKETYQEEQAELAFDESEIEEQVMKR